MEHKNMNTRMNHYSNLTLMALLSFIVMYILMYAMVDIFGNVYLNINQFYMAGMMTAPMVMIELITMGMMYENKRLNAIILAVCVIVGVVFFLLIRQQSAVGDKQFLRSMIPHHGAAILMCEQAPIQDPEIQELCAGILTSQQREIDQMQAKLSELEQ